MSEQGQPLNKLLLIGAVTATLFFIYNLYLVSQGHFHEDAYILFVYVENLTNGQGISFYPGGPNAEGATDFLWFMMLSALAMTGLDVGTCAIVVNAIGVGIISAIIANEITRAGIEDHKQKLMLSLFVLFWAMLSPLAAAVGGFSVYAYMALVLLNFVALSRDEHIGKLPYLAIILALFRPDGVIMGVTFTLFGLYKVAKTDKLKPYLVGMAIAFVIGVTYFVWRFNYFGNLLPLPLYVKGHEGMLAGLRPNLAWGFLHLYLLLPFAYLVLGSKKLKHYLFLMAPVILLFAILTVAKQSQNIGYRFQAPVLMICYFVFVQLLLARLKANKPGDWLPKVLPVYLLGFIGWAGYQIDKSQEITEFNYINQAPFVMNQQLPKGLTIAMTEAGRFPFWNQAGEHTIVDLVGLNSVYPAKNIIDVGYMEELSPDVIMYHHNYNIDAEPFVKAKAEPNTRVYHLNAQSKPHFKLNKPFAEDARDKLSKVTLAAVVTTEYLQKHYDSYDIFLVDYLEDDKLYHVYGFKKSLDLADSMSKLIDNAFERSSELSYYQMIELRGSGQGATTQQ